MKLSQLEQLRNIGM